MMPIECGTPEKTGFGLRLYRLRILGSYASLKGCFGGGGLDSSAVHISTAP